MRSAEDNSLFLIHGWFYLVHCSIPSWSTKTFFRCLPGAQFSDCITFLTTLSFAIFPSQCAPAALAVWSTSRFSLTWLAHKCMTCITLWTFLIWFLQTILFLQVYFCLSSNISDNTDSLTWWIAFKMLSRA